MPSTMFSSYSFDPPPVPSRSSAPYQPVIPESAPTLTEQLAFGIGTPVDERQVELPITIAHGMRSLPPTREPICAAALAPTVLVVWPSTRPKTQLKLPSSSTYRGSFGESVVRTEIFLISEASMPWLTAYC